MDANTLRKTWENALPADGAANALQVLGVVPELATLIETWFSIPDEARTVIVRQAPLIQIGVRE